MTKSDIIVGLLIRSHPDVFVGHGVVEYISDDEFVGIQWYDYRGKSGDFSEIPIKDVLRALEYHGWTVLSSLEKELI
jgi:hypothetical protein